MMRNQGPPCLSCQPGHCACARETARQGAPHDEEHDGSRPHPRESSLDVFGSLSCDAARPWRISLCLFLLLSSCRDSDGSARGWISQNSGEICPITSPAREILLQLPKEMPRWLAGRTFIAMLSRDFQAKRIGGESPSEPKIRSRLGLGAWFLIFFKKRACDLCTISVCL